MLKLQLYSHLLLAGLGDGVGLVPPALCLLVGGGGGDVLALGPGSLLGLPGFLIPP